MNNKIPNLTPLTALIVSLGLTASKTTPTLVSQVMYLLIILSLISKQVCEELESKYHQPNIIIQSDGQNSHNYKPKNKRKTKFLVNQQESQALCQNENLNFLTVHQIKRPVHKVITPTIIVRKRGIHDVVN